MNGQKLFFLSLIILSVVMGQNWLKNRPKKAPKKPGTEVTRTAVNIDDLQIASDTAGTGTDPETATDTEGVASDTEHGEPDPENVANASDSAKPDEDPIMSGWQKLARTPFEASPFMRMIEEAKARAAEEQAKAGLLAAVKTKPVQELQANFTGTIQTEQEIVAIIDRSLFRQGKDYQDKKITNVERNLVTLEDQNAIYLLPKKGWRVVINASGPPTLVDNAERR